MEIFQNLKKLLIYSLEWKLKKYLGLISVNSLVKLNVPTDETT